VRAENRGRDACATLGVRFAGSGGPPGTGGLQARIAAVVGLARLAGAVQLAAVALSAAGRLVRAGVLDFPQGLAGPEVVNYRAFAPRGAKAHRARSIRDGAAL